MPNILIVEDDININNLLCEVLRKAGYTCEQAFSGTEAKLLLNIKEKAYTLVLLDLMLPGASGEEVLKEIRKHGRLPVIVAEGTMDKLLDGYEFGDDFSGIRNSVIIEMLYTTGMRRAELTGLKDADVDLQGATVRVTGKRNKQRIIPLLKPVTKRLEEYIKVRNECFPVRQESWFFIGNKGNKLYDKYVYNIVRKYLAMVTTIEKKSPHILRHSFATHMLNRGADLNSIKEFLGHANLSATQIYTHNSFEQLRKIYKQAHPRA